jgi:hypothetical protein
LATKDATVGTQTCVGLFPTNDWHKNNKLNITKNKTEILKLKGNGNVWEKGIL